MIVKTNNEFEGSINNGVVLVDFYADWCGPCKMLSPIIDEISRTWENGKVLKVNIDNIPELAEKFDVKTIPTLIYLKDGKEIERTIGFKTKDVIISKLNALK